jgi:hypothetical protein
MLATYLTVWRYPETLSHINSGQGLGNPQIWLYGAQVRADDYIAVISSEISSGFELLPVASSYLSAIKGLISAVKS